MNRNKKLVKQITAGIAVGMAAVMGATPVLASTDAVVSKEETVYVNADVQGAAEQVTVSSWLKNAGSEKSLKDESDLKDIYNVKGEEEFTQQGKKITWQTDGADIYYQGTSEKELPVSVKFTYYLNGKEMKPEELSGKSGKLKIRVAYENHAKVTSEINGEQVTMYSPFVMVTGMILPDDTFTNVVIDNGKVISDGKKNIVVGVGMPGLAESLKLKETSLDGRVLKETEEINLPESLEITADVTDFSIGPTFTFAMSDLLDNLDTENMDTFDELKDSLNDLEDAALLLVDGTEELSDGVNTLDDKYQEFHEGIGTLKDGISVLKNGAAALEEGIGSYTKGADQLNDGIQTYLGGNGVLTGKVKEYVNGVNTVVKGVEQYTDGVNTLAGGVSSYVAGEQQLAKGAKELEPLVSGLTALHEGTARLNAVLDGEGAAAEDIKVASGQLADGTAQLSESLKQMDALLDQVDQMTEVGNALIAEAGTLSDVMQNQITVPVQEMMAAGEQLKGQLAALSSELRGLQAKAQQAIDQAGTALAASVNAQIEERNAVIDEDSRKLNEANAAITSAQQILDSQIAAARDSGNEELANQLQNARNQLGTVPADLAKLDPVAGPEISVDLSVDPEMLQAIAGTMESMQKSYEQVETAVGGLAPRLAEMQEQLNAISSVEIPETPMQNLKAAVNQLNAGMQGLDGAIGSLSVNVAALNQSTAALPAAGEGIGALLNGFEALNAYNSQLLDGAAALQKNGPTLVQGVAALQSGTNQLSDGLGALGSQLLGGASQLSANSGQLRSGASSLLSGVNTLSSGANTLQDGSSQVKDGISELKDGAAELKDGMKEFDEEGTGKLKETVDDELGDLLDRIRALNSDENSYTTYSGRAEGMDGTVKFIIETEGVD